MRILYVEHKHSKGHVQGMMKAYRRVSSEFQSFNDRLTAKKHGKDAMNKQFVQAATEFEPDFIHLGKCESLQGESVCLVKEATGATVIHFYPDYGPKVKSYVADIGRYADMTVLPHRGKALWEAHKRAGCKRVGFWWGGTDPECYYPHDVPKEYDVVFMANSPTRETGRGMGRFALVSALADAGISVHIFTLSGGDWAKRGLKPHENIYMHAYVDREEFSLACSKARIALGYNTDQVYMYTCWHRWVNSMASGAFFLGRWFPGLGEVFKARQHLVWFESIEDAVELAILSLSHPDERELIAKAGRAEVLKHHTWDNRIAQMMGYVKQIKEEG